MALNRTEEIKRALERLYEHLDDVQRDTLQGLGTDTLHFVDFHANNWIDMVRWIDSKYTRDEQMNIVTLHFLRVFKEIYWLQLLFQNANYPMIYRNLRYILEMICQAYYADMRYPNLTLDEQVEKAKEIENEVYGWMLVGAVLRDVFTEDNVRSRFHPLWKHLCKHVHPSPTEMDVTAVKDFSILVTDSFNEELARNAMKATDEVFDIVNTIMFRRFPRIKELAHKYEFLDEWITLLPYTVATVRATTREHRHD
jgi:hypothetical protein